MLKIVKYLAIAIAALLVLLLAAGAYLAATFDPNEYKPQIIKLVQEKTQRTLAIPGEIKLSFFPGIGADLGALSISERNSSEVFAAVDSARVSLELLPLLSRQLVVDRVRIDGLRATIRRDRKGTVNVDDLLGSKESGEAETKDKKSDPIAFDVGGIDVNNAHLVYDDRQAGRRIEIRDLELTSGRIADRIPSDLQLQAQVQSKQPQIDARVAANTGFTLDLQAGRYRLQGLDAQIKGALAGVSDATFQAKGDADLRPADKRFALSGIGIAGSGKRDGQPFELKLDLPQLAVTDARVEGGKLIGELKLTQDARRIAANFRVPAFEGTPQAFRLPAVELDASVAGDELDLRAALGGAVAGDIDKLLFQSPQLTLTVSGKQGTTPIKGSLTTPLVLDLNKRTVDLPKLGADFSLPNPAGGTLALKASGRAGAQLADEAVTAKLEGSLDQSAFTARLGMNGFAAPAYRFDIGIDRLDLDRYRKQAAAGAGTAGGGGADGDKAGGKTGGEGGGGNSAPAAAEQPIDLSALRDLRATGSLRVGALKAGGLNTSDVRVNLRAASGKLEIDPFSAKLYGGSTNGAITVSAAQPARYALRQSLSGVNIGPLLKDAFDKDVLEGRGDVQLDLTAAGASVAQLKRALNGSARVALRDGAIRGVNIAQSLRSAKARLDTLRGREAAQAGTGSSAEKTDFSELSGSFKITNGVARNDDLDMKSPLLRVAGAGEIDLAAERLNYLVRATVVSSLQGQGGPELQALKGVTVPVRLAGPFSAIDWQVDVGAIAGELVRRKLDERKDEAKAGVQKSLEEEKAKVKEQLKEQLRGLFGK